MSSGPPNSSDKGANTELDCAIILTIIPAVTEDDLVDKSTEESTNSSPAKQTVQSLQADQKKARNATLAIARKTKDKLESLTPELAQKFPLDIDIVKEIRREGLSIASLFVDDKGVAVKNPEESERALITNGQPQYRVEKIIHYGHVIYCFISHMAEEFAHDVEKRLRNDGLELNDNQKKEMSDFKTEKYMRPLVDKVLNIDSKAYNYNFLWAAMDWKKLIAHNVLEINDPDKHDRIEEIRGSGGATID